MDEEKLFRERAARGEGKEARAVKLLEKVQSPANSLGKR
jgi:hypothetical protein